MEFLETVKELIEDSEISNIDKAALMRMAEKIDAEEDDFEEEEEIDIEDEVG